MNNVWFWEKKFKPEINNVPTFGEFEKKFNIKVFIFSNIVNSDIQRYINDVYDFYIIVLTEHKATDNVIKIIEKYQDKVLVLSNVIAPNTPLTLDNENFFYSGDWLESPVYRENPLHNLNLLVRKYDFDCLIGRPESCRDYLFESLKDKEILSRSLYSYKTSTNVLRFDVETSNLISLNRLPSIATPQDSLEKFNYDASPFFADIRNEFVFPALSRITPKEIYKHSFASIVRETCLGDYTKNFFATEKTAKPIWAGRLFFPIANQNYCKTLEQLGIKMYYDYSYYDEEPNVFKRVDKFTDYIASLSSDDLVNMYHSNKNNIRHNYKFVSKNWAQAAYDFIVSRIK